MKVKAGVKYVHKDLGRVDITSLSSIDGPGHVQVKAKNGWIYNVKESDLTENVYPKKMHVWDDAGDKSRMKIETVIAHESRLMFPYLVEQDSDTYLGYKHAEDIPQTKELTMQEIADKFNIPVDQLKIKK